MNSKRNGEAFERGDKTSYVREQKLFGGRKVLFLKHRVFEAQRMKNEGR